MSACTIPSQAVRDLRWLRLAAAHAASPEVASPPDLALLTNDPAEPEDFANRGAIRRATVGLDPRDGGAALVVQLADMRDGVAPGALRRGRPVAPAIGAALRVLCWYGGAGDHPNSTGSLVRDRHTAFLFGGGRTGTAADCEATALALFGRNHEASRLPYSRSEYREAVAAALALVTAYWAALATSARESHRAA